MRDRKERKHRRTWAHPESVAMVAAADFSAAPPLNVAMTMQLPVQLVRDAPACQWHPDKLFDVEPCCTLPNGSWVEYKGHVIGGNVHVKTQDGRDLVIHPGTIKNLR